MIRSAGVASFDEVAVVGRRRAADFFFRPGMLAKNEITFFDELLCWRKVERRISIRSRRVPLFTTSRWFPDKCVRHPALIDERLRSLYGGEKQPATRATVVRHRCGVLAVGNAVPLVPFYGTHLQMG